LIFIQNTGRIILSINTKALQNVEDVLGDLSDQRFLNFGCWLCKVNVGNRDQSLKLIDGSWGIKRVAEGFSNSELGFGKSCR
jgi:hypothetical protein